MMKSSILLILCLFCLNAMSGQDTKKINPDLLDYFPQPAVDRRIELLSIVFRLAGNWEYNDESFKSYTDDIHNYFDKYKDHPLIVFATEMRDKGVSFDAVMKMAFHLEQPPLLSPIIPLTSEVPDGRWGQDNADKFAKLLREFYVDANCEKFFAEHEKLYLKAQANFSTVYNTLDVDWYKQYYGVKPEGKFNTVLCLGNGGGNYGGKIVYADGKEDAYAIMGTWSIDSTGSPFYNVSDYLPLLIHEYNHSYVNHLTYKNASELENSGKLLFDIVKVSMRKLSYGSWETMMSEALVRASVIRYLMKHNADSKIAIDKMNEEIGYGFYWMKALVDCMGEYENNRDKYPSLDSYMPVLINFYNGIASESDSISELKNN